MKIKEVIKRLTCKHDWVVIMPVRGSVRNKFGAVCKCKKCGKETLR